MWCQLVASSDTTQKFIILPIRVGVNEQQPLPCVGPERGRHSPVAAARGAGKGVALHLAFQISWLASLLSRAPTSTCCLSNSLVIWRLKGEAHDYPLSRVKASRPHGETAPTIDREPGIFHATHAPRPQVHVGTARGSWASHVGALGAANGERP